MCSNKVIISSVWIKKVSFFYLGIPFIIFCFGYLKLFIALTISILLIILYIKNWKYSWTEERLIEIPKKTIYFTIIIIIVWVLLSGIGGFAFQNSDFHIRNAIFRDLINKSWPVAYNTNLSNSSITYFLTYYIGFWMPAALVGKIAGWQVANIVLYLWTVFGVILTILLLSSKFKLTLPLITLLLVFFSGMDGLGVFLEQVALPGKTISLWPPIMHLEWWAPGFQFSSFTTQLFWVFNQTVPTWICMALLLTTNDKKFIFLIWGLCAFFAPIPALGMFPYVILKIPQQMFVAEYVKGNSLINHHDSLISRCWKDIRSVLTIENILGGGIVLIISFLYFSSNVNSAVSTVNSESDLHWFFYIIFIIFDALLLWSIFRRQNYANANWYLAGILILVIPLIKVGNSQDFCMRASIPTLFMLMVWSAELLAAPRSQARIVLIVFLCIGAITPIYEINRSVYRTASYYLDPPSQSEKLIGQQIRIYEIESFEYDHPYTLTADSFKSLANIDPDSITFFLAKSDQSFFYKYLVKKSPLESNVARLKSTSS